jgi:hypothetical protein
MRNVPPVPERVSQAGDTHIHVQQGGQVDCEDYGRVATAQFWAGCVASEGGAEERARGGQGEDSLEGYISNMHSRCFIVRDGSMSIFEARWGCMKVNASLDGTYISHDRA